MGGTHVSTVQLTVCSYYWLSDDAEPVSDAVASSDDSEKDADEAADAGDDDDDSKDSSLMLAENMEAQQQEQKFRAKRDLDANEIRELFESQNARQDDSYVPG